MALSRQIEGGFRQGYLHCSDRPLWNIHLVSLATESQSCYERHGQMEGKQILGCFTGSTLFDRAQEPQNLR